MSKTIDATLEQICLQEKGSIISGPFGSNISSKFFVDDGVPVIRGNNLSLTCDKFYDNDFVFVTKEKAEELKCYAYRDDLIFTAAGTIGQVGIIPKDSKYKEYVISNKQIRARIDTDKADLLYAYYWFSSPWIQKQLKHNNKGSTVPLLTLSEVRNLPIKYPEDIKEQKRIANCLETISKKIENNKQINDNLQQLIQTIYNYWFAQFDFPDETGKPYRSSGGKMIWNEQLKCKIPLGWSVASVIENPISSGIKPGIKKFASKEYLATAEINGTTISPGTIIDYGNRESRANMQPSVNSIWFAKMKNSVKHLFLNNEMNSLIDNVILSTGFCGIQCTENSFEYIASFISSKYFETMKDTLAHGATQEAVNNNDLQSIPLIIPEERVLTAYHEICQSLYSQFSNNICENRKLIATRDWLLPMLMNGQATITD